MRCLALVIVIALAGCEESRGASMPASPASASVNKLDPTVTLTDEALALLRTFAGDRDLGNLHVRVAVVAEGDAFRYLLNFTDPARDDVAYTWKGVKFQIDRTSARYLHGAVIDASAPASCCQPGFRFINPNSLGPAYAGRPGELPPPVKLKTAY